MMLRSVWLAAGLVLWAGSAGAEVVRAKGYGDTPSAAITDAAVNAIRSVSGSHVTVKQEFKSQIDKGVPDETFLETMLEVSRGSITHLAIQTVNKVGNIYEASIIVDVDPAKLQTATGKASQLSVKPGALATGAAKARLQKDATTQLDDAIRRFMAVETKTVQVLAVAPEADEHVTSTMAEQGAVQDGQVVVKVTFSYSSAPDTLKDLRDVLKVAGEESSLRHEGDWFGCSAEVRRQKVIYVFQPPQQGGTVGSVSCGYSTDYDGALTGAPDAVYLIDEHKALGSAINDQELIEGATLHLDLGFSDGKHRLMERSFSFNSLAMNPIEGGLSVGLVDAGGEWPKRDGSVGSFSEPLGSQRLEPAVLLATEGAPAHRAVFLSTRYFAVDLALSAKEAEELTGVSVAVTRE